MPEQLKGVDGILGGDALASSLEDTGRSCLQPQIDRLEVGPFHGKDNVFAQWFHASGAFKRALHIPSGNFITQFDHTFVVGEELVVENLNRVHLRKGREDVLDLVDDGGRGAVPDLATGEGVEDAESAGKGTSPAGQDFRGAPTFVEKRFMPGKGQFIQVSDQFPLRRNAQLPVVEIGKSIDLRPVTARFKDLCQFAKGRLGFTQTERAVGKTPGDLLFHGGDVPPPTRSGCPDGVREPLQ